MITSSVSFLFCASFQFSRRFSRQIILFLFHRCAKKWLVFDEIWNLFSSSLNEQLICISFCLNISFCQWQRINVFSPTQNDNEIRSNRIRNIQTNFWSDYHLHFYSISLDFWFHKISDNKQENSWDFLSDSFFSRISSN